MESSQKVTKVHQLVKTKITRALLGMTFALNQRGTDPYKPSEIKKLENATKMVYIEVIPMQKPASDETSLKPEGKMKEKRK